MPSGGGKPMSLEELATAMAQADQLELKLIIKADVQGSVEAVSDALIKLSTEKVKVSVVHSARRRHHRRRREPGGRRRRDHHRLQRAPGRQGRGARPEGGRRDPPVHIIYNVVDDVKTAMEGLLAPTLVEKTIGKAEVRQVFKISKAGTVAGCMVIEGVDPAQRRARASARRRRGLAAARSSSLKRFKDDAREVKEGFECGIALDGYHDIKKGDIIEAFEVEEVKQTL